LARSLINPLSQPLNRNRPQHPFDLLDQLRFLSASLNPLASCSRSNRIKKSHRSFTMTFDPTTQTNHQARELEQRMNLANTQNRKQIP
jgi:hypothetical protein